MTAIVGLWLSTGWALNRCFYGIVGPLLFAVLNGGWGVCDALVEGKRGPVMSVSVHCVHNNIIPHITTPTRFVWVLISAMAKE